MRSKSFFFPKTPMTAKTLLWRSAQAPGGDEAALFAAEIYRMYVKYAESSDGKQR